MGNPDALVECLFLNEREKFMHNPSCFLPSVVVKPRVGLFSLATMAVKLLAQVDLIGKISLS